MIDIMPIDPEALAASLRRLASFGKPGIGVVEALRHVTEACIDLFGVAGSGIMLADEQNIPRYVAASDGPGRMLEVAESDTGQGPCTEAFVTSFIVIIILNFLAAQLAKELYLTLYGARSLFG